MTIALKILNFLGGGYFTFSDVCTATRQGVLIVHCPKTVVQQEMELAVEISNALANERIVFAAMRELDAKMHQNIFRKSVTKMIEGGFTYEQLQDIIQEEILLEVHAK